jgi:hypothetical protein
MKTNMGKTDRLLRGLLGLAAVGLFFTAWIPAPFHWISLAAGVLLLFTASVGVCPGYVPFGWNTCSTKKAP